MDWLFENFLTVWLLGWAVILIGGYLLSDRGRQYVERDWSVK